MVVFPAPERPVNQRVKPRPFSGARPCCSPLPPPRSSSIYAAPESPTPLICRPRRAWAHDPSRNPSMRILTTSGRENSDGGYSPLPNISLTFVPEKKTCEEGSCGQVLAEAIPRHSLQKKACSK